MIPSGAEEINPGKVIWNAMCSLDSDNRAGNNIMKMGILRILMISCASF